MFQLDMIQMSLYPVELYTRSVGTVKSEGQSCRSDGFLETKVKGIR